MFTQNMFKNFSEDSDTRLTELTVHLYKSMDRFGHIIETAFIVNALLDVAKGKKPLNGDAMRQAAILDAIDRKIHFVKMLIELGAQYNNGDIEDIRPMNKEAAKLMEKNFRMRAKL